MKKLILGFVLMSFVLQSHARVVPELSTAAQNLTRALTIEKVQGEDRKRAFFNFGSVVAQQAETMTEEEIFSDLQQIFGNKGANEVRARIASKIEEIRNAGGKLDPKQMAIFAADLTKEQLAKRRDFSWSFDEKTGEGFIVAGIIVLGLGAVMCAGGGCQMKDSEPESEERAERRVAFIIMGSGAAMLVTGLAITHD